MTLYFRPLMTIDFSSADDADDADFLSKFTLLCHSERPSLSSRAKRSVAKDLEYIHFRLRYVPEILPPYGRLDDNK